MPDPRSLAEFLVSLHGEPGVGRTTLARALMDFPVASDGDLTRFFVSEATSDGAPGSGAAILVVRGSPTEAARARLADLFAQGGRVLVAVHARDLDRDADEAVRDAWGEVLDPTKVHLTAAPTGGTAVGVEELRATLVTMALDGVETTVAEARRAKRPFAVSIIAAAALAAAVEGLLPGAAAFVLATQVGAISSLSYLYTGRWMSRAQALGMIPMFASEAAGASMLLIVKSFLPPTGIVDAAAAALAASLTIAMLGAVTLMLERGYSLEQKEELRQAFRRLRARSVAERSEILRNRTKWRDRSFWRDLVQRLIFES